MRGISLVRAITGQLAVRQRSQSCRRGYHKLTELTSSPSSLPKARLIPKYDQATPGDAAEVETVPESSAMAAKRAAWDHKRWQWSALPKNILLVQKPNDVRAEEAMGKIISYITNHHPSISLIIESHSISHTTSHPNLIVTSPDDIHLLPNAVDVVITVGGDGTVLHTSNLFGYGECPPVLSFSMGSLGFLLPFHIDSMAETIENTLRGSELSALERMRLSCMPVGVDGEPLNCGKTVGPAGWQVMNEVALHRGRHPHLTVVDAYFDGQHLTEAVADGLLLSTPTGSTAYSLSAGGPISHPETDAFLLTPIAPRSLSFRTVVLPGRGVVRLEISPLARSPCELSVDGREVCFLSAGESVVISKSPFPIPCIERSEGGSGWVRDINSLLQFNVGFRNKSLVGHHDG